GYPRQRFERPGHAPDASPASKTALRSSIVAQNVREPDREIFALALNRLCSASGAEFFTQESKLIGHAFVLQGNVFGVPEEVFLVEECFDVAQAIFDKLIWILFEIVGAGCGPAIFERDVACLHFMVDCQAAPKVERYTARSPVIPHQPTFDQG